MPELGEIRRADQLGRIGRAKLIWFACKECGVERWVYMKKGKPEYELCGSCGCKGNYNYCSGKPGGHSNNWKGGTYKTNQGYILIWLYPDNFFYSMVNKSGYVMEHRLVMAKKLGRCLQDWEIVHHKGIRHSGIQNKADNLEDNLELSDSIGGHILNHSKGYRDGYSKGLIDGRNKQIQELQNLIQEQGKIIRLLSWQTQPNKRDLLYSEK